MFNGESQVSVGLVHYNSSVFSDYDSQIPPSVGVSLVSSDGNSSTEVVALPVGSVFSCGFTVFSILRPGFSQVGDDLSPVPSPVVECSLFECLFSVFDLNYLPSLISSYFFSSIDSKSSVTFSASINSGISDDGFLPSDGKFENISGPFFAEFVVDFETSFEFSDSEGNFSSVFDCFFQDEEFIESNVNHAVSLSS